MEAVKAFYLLLEASGTPKRYTHDLTSFRVISASCFFASMSMFSSQWHLYTSSNERKNILGCCFCRMNMLIGLQSSVGIQSPKNGENKCC